MDLVVRVKGEVLASNFQEYKEKMIATVDSINTDLQTDEDFALAKEAAKNCKAAEKALADAEADAISQTGSINELLASMREVSGLFRDKRLFLDKEVKRREGEIKKEAVAAAELEIVGLIEASNRSAKGTYIIDKEAITRAVTAKRTVETMAKAGKEEAARQMVEFNKLSDLIDSNTSLLAPYIEEHPPLYHDKKKLVAMESGAMLEVAESRKRTFLAEQEARRIESQAAEERKKTESPAEKPGPVETPNDVEKQGGFTVTVVLDCDSEKAVRIAKTLNNTMDAYGDAVVSINLTRRKNDITF